MAVYISVRVCPDSARNEVMDFSGEIWRVKISAPPVRGKANQELLTFLSQILGVGRSSLSIDKGHSSRNKVVAVEGLTREEITKRFFSSTV